jgi:hypothetical protein
VFTIKLVLEGEGTILQVRDIQVAFHFIQLLQGTSFLASKYGELYYENNGRFLVILWTNIMEIQFRDENRSIETSRQNGTKCFGLIVGAA